MPLCLRCGPSLFNRSAHFNILLQIRNRTVEPAGQRIPAMPPQGWPSREPEDAEETAAWLLPGPKPLR